MSVLIKGMEIPGACCACPCSYDNQCAVTNQYPTFDEWYGDRPSWCPLVPVPPHGRLIDADKLDYSNTDLLGNHIVYMVDIEDAPTIIPAEEGEG